MDKTFGIRRSKEELDEFKSEKRRVKFILVEQDEFKGSDELLKYMQDAERAYRDGEPLISDEEWDKLVAKTDYVESLDQVVSSSGRKLSKMGAPLVSLNKITDIDALKKFVGNKKVIVAPKLDGLPYNAFYYENDEGGLDLTEIGSRGDGIYSIIIHDGALEGVDVFGLPKHFDKDTTDMLRENGAIMNGRFELRGEAVIDKFKYASDNDLPINEMVPRSISSGIFNRIKTTSIKTFKEELYEMLGSNNVDVMDKDTFDNIAKSITKDINKYLGSFGLTGRKSDNKSIISVMINNELKIYKNTKSNPDKIVEMIKPEGKLRVENLHMITFSIATINGNEDKPELIRQIPGINYIGDVKDFIDADVYKITDNIDEVIKVVDKIYGTVNGVRDMSKPRFKMDSRFALDGVVIKVVGSNSKTQKLNRKRKNGTELVSNKPLDQVAIKLMNDPVRTKILKITKKKTSLGNITCRADIEPTIVDGGAVVKSVNLHNENWLKMPENSWIKEGVECELRLSMDIIPILSPIE